MSRHVVVVSWHPTSCGDPAGRAAAQVVAGCRAAGDRVSAITSDVWPHLSSCPSSDGDVAADRIWTVPTPPRPDDPFPRQPRLTGPAADRVDPMVAWSGRAALVLSALHRTDPVDLVVTVGPPTAAHTAASTMVADEQIALVDIALDDPDSSARAFAALGITPAVAPASAMRPQRTAILAVTVASDRHPFADDDLDALARLGASVVTVELDAQQPWGWRSGDEPRRRRRWRRGAAGDLSRRSSDRLAGWLTQRLAHRHADAARIVLVGRGPVAEAAATAVAQADARIVPYVGGTATDLARGAILGGGTIPAPPLVYDSPLLVLTALPEVPGDAGRAVVTPDGRSHPADAPAGCPRAVLAPGGDGRWLSVGPPGDDEVVVRAAEVRTDGSGVAVHRAGPARRASVDPPRLLIGPANSAGQGDQWAGAVRRHLPATATTLHVMARVGYTSQSDLRLSAQEWADPSVRVRLALDAVLPASHVLLETMRPIIGAADGSPTAHGWTIALGEQDVRAVHDSGRRVAVLFHGSEARRPAVHATIDPATPFDRPEHADATARLVTTTTQVHDALESLRADIPDLPVFVSTLDMLDHVPGAVWLPLTISRASFAPAEPALRGRVPVVLHAPTNPFLKGSEVVDEVLTRLEAEGAIVYRRLAGEAHWRMPGILREVDVVVDQVVLGNPGVLAAEAMAAGRLVVAHLTPRVRARFPGPPPVLEADRFTIEAVLRSILDDPATARALADAGPGFARDLHDGRRSAEVLAAFLAS